MKAEVCDVCGSTDVKEIKCKLICRNCGTILRSCADLLYSLIKVNYN
jgi:rubredoxin